MKEINAYQCDYCKKYSKSKSVIKKHESKCFYNPITRACATCGNYYQDHFKIQKTNAPFDYGGDVYGLRPICKAGKRISDLKDGNVTVDLCNSCECWIEKEED